MKHYLARLHDAIKNLHGCESTHVSTVPVIEKYDGLVVWEGHVEVFSLESHPKAHTCYSWASQDDDGKEQYKAVLHIPPVRSPHTAVKAAIDAQVKQHERKET